MPFSIANVLSRAFDALRRHALLIFGLNLILTGVPQAIKDAAFWLPDGFFLSNEIVQSLLGIVAGLGSLVYYALITQRLMADYHQRPFRFGAALSLALISLIPMIVIAVCYMLLVSLGLILLIIPGIIVAIGFSLSFAIYVAEPRAGLFGAMTKSWRLTENRRWPLFAIYLIGIVLTGLINSVFDAPLILIQGLIPYLPPFIGALSNALTDVIIVVFSLAAYLCLKEDAEGRPAETTADIFS